MLSSWATKRKLIYASSVVLFLAIIFYIVFFKFVYVAPTCSDGIKNGSETGVDCGGSCTTICTSDALTPVVYWAKVFNVSGTVYSLAAYIENPNISTENSRAGYEFRVYDKNNALIDSRKGETFIPKNKKFIIFEPGFVSKNATPKRVEFSFVSFGPWQKVTNVDEKISISHSALLSTSTIPRIEGTVTNNSVDSNNGLELIALISDSKENAVAVSRTFVDPMSAKSTQDFVFTWPKPFQLGVEECSTPLDVALTLDRSGSMRSESMIPPEPFSTVKSTAEDFIKTLADGDRVSVVSFGNSSDLNSELSNDKQKAMNSIGDLSLGTTSEQTNIAEGLMTSFKELTSNIGSNKQVIILLTDGAPTEPTKSGDKEYPKTYAQKIALDILSGPVSIFTIGLGKDVDSSYLKSLVSDDDHYFFAPTKEKLSSIYASISSALCVKKPSAVNIIYRVLK